MMRNKSNRSSEEKLTKNLLGAASQNTNLEINGFTTLSNFSAKTRFLPVSKQSYKKGNEKSEEKETECSNFLEVAAQPVNESRSLVDKELKSIESTEDSNTVLGITESHTDIITSPKPRFDLAPGEFAFKSKLNYLLNSSEITYECYKCGEKSFNRTSFIRHYKSHSAKNLVVSSDSQNINSSKTQLETQTLDEKPFACNKCEKRFTWNSHLINHYRIHTNEKPFVFDLCKKAFRNQSNLNEHYIIHAYEKPFVCKKCGKGFNRKRLFVVHERTHTGEKTYECDVCEKRFNHKHHLADHHRTHTGEKPYECGICRKRFSQRSSLNTHTRRHTKEKPFQCELCQKRYKNQAYFMFHRRQHTVEKP